ncbi:MAG: LysR substrate-binding domain-containing protein [Dongiaceae bacterium]
MADFHRLRYFIAVAEELNFTRAAERLHIAQPSLSQQIRLLENDVGVPLLIRDNRKVELTAAGLRFLGEARSLLEHARCAIMRVRQSDDSDHLKIGFVIGLILELLPRLLPSIRASFPGVELVVRSMPPHELEQALKSEVFDVIFSRMRPDNKGLIVESLFQEPLIAVFPETHSKAVGEGPISLLELQEFEIIAGTTSVFTELRKCLDEKCAELGISLNIAHEVSNIFEALPLIADGYGIGLFSRTLSCLIPSHLRYRVLDTSGPQVNVAVAYRAGVKSDKIDRLLRISRLQLHAKQA